MSKCFTRLERTCSCDAGPHLRYRVKGLDDSECGIHRIEMKSHSNSSDSGGHSACRTKLHSRKRLIRSRRIGIAVSQSTATISHMEAVEKTESTSAAKDGDLPIHLHVYETAICETFAASRGNEPHRRRRRILFPCIGGLLTSPFFSARARRAFCTFCACPGCTYLSSTDALPHSSY